MEKNYKININILFLVIISFFFLIFSYFWVDLALGLMLSDSHPELNRLLSLYKFTESSRKELSFLYIALIFLFFCSQNFFLFIFKKFNNLSLKNILIISILVAFFFSFSYPFLSYDMFTYLFSSRMIFSYRLNPYEVSPENLLPSDLWVGFMRNIQFTYNYGPVALIFSSIPMLFLSANRFILNFFAYKLLNGLVFFITGILLLKLLNNDKKVFIFWFLNPFLLIELLANSHNDLLMIGLFILSLFLASKRKKFLAITFFVLAFLTKFVSILGLPLFISFIRDKNSLFYKKRKYLSRVLVLILFLFLYFQKIRGVHNWYYSWFFMFLPFCDFKNLSWIFINIIFFLKLLGYYNFLSLKTYGESNFPFLNLIQFISILGIFGIESSKIYHRKIKYWLLTFVIWSGQKWRKIIKKE